MDTKICSKCRLKLGLDQFNRTSSYCRKCRAEWQKEYRKTDKNREYMRKWRLTPDQIAKAKEREKKQSVKDYRKKYRQAWGYFHSEKYRQKMKGRLLNDVQFKLATRLRIRMYCALKQNNKAGSAIKELGCTVSELKSYLEKQFKDGMTWKNWGKKGWHIDHVKPLSSFDLTDSNQFAKAVHYTNLQPMWAEENLSKSNKC